MDELLDLTTWRTLLVVIPLGVALIVSAGWDWRHKKIPNVVTYPTFVVGLVVHGVVWGPWGLAWAFGAALTTFVIGIFLMLPNWVGGGDVKLLVGVAAFLGFGGLGEVLFYAIWAGFLLGLVLAFLNGYLVEMVRRIGRFLLGLVRQAAYQTGQVGEKLETDERSKVPFGVAIFAGFALAYTDARFDWPGLLDWFLTTSI